MTGKLLGLMFTGYSDEGGDGAGFVQLVMLRSTVQARVNIFPKHSHKNAQWTEDTLLSHTIYNAQAKETEEGANGPPCALQIYR